MAFSVSMIRAVRRLSSCNRSRCRIEAFHSICRPIEKASHLVERQPDIPVEHDFLQPQHLDATVKPVPVGADMRRFQQPDVIIMMQGPDRHTGEPGQLTH